jgi:hypothetical protein
MLLHGWQRRLSPAYLSLPFGGLRDEPLHAGFLIRRLSRNCVRPGVPSSRVGQSASEAAQVALPVTAFNLHFFPYVAF